MDNITTNENQQIIDQMPIERCLRLWRFAPAGSRWTTGELGDLLGARLSEYRNTHPDEWVALSKHIGWEK